MKSALVIGASRGIGRQIALTLGENGYKVCVAAKTVQGSDKLPGSIEMVANEIRAKGGDAFAKKCDVRFEKELKDTVQECLHHFDRLDYAIYNAGAIAWKPVLETPLKQFDLMNEVNVRGAYIMIQEVLPHFLKQNSGKILLVCPPIYNRFFKGKTPYAVTKCGMTILVHGLANELKETGVSVTGLWPATVIESHVTTVQNLPTQYMRTAHIFADAVLKIGQEPTQRLNGQALIDEDYLRSIGMNDFTKYRCDPLSEPPRMMPKQMPSLLVEEENESLSWNKPKL